MIYDRFHILRAFPRSELPVGAGAVANNPLDVRHFSLAAEFFNLCRDKFEQLVQQIPFVYFGFLPEVDQFSVDTVARGAPEVLIKKTLPINPKGDEIRWRAARY